MSFGPAGSIRASIVLQGSDIWLLEDDDTNFLSWEQGIRIEADEENRQAISRDQAIDIAQTQPAYDTFRLTHSGEAVAKEEDGQYWVNYGGTWKRYQWSSIRKHKTK